MFYCLAPFSCFHISKHDPHVGTQRGLGPSVCVTLGLSVHSQALPSSKLCGERGGWGQCGWGVHSWSSRCRGQGHAHCLVGDSDESSLLKRGEAMQANF